MDKVSSHSILKMQNTSAMLLKVKPAETELVGSVGVTSADWRVVQLKVIGK